MEFSTEHLLPCYQFFRSFSVQIKGKSLKKQTVFLREGDIFGKLLLLLLFSPTNVCFTYKRLVEVSVKLVRCIEIEMVYKGDPDTKFNNQIYDLHVGIPRIIWIHYNNL